MIRPPKLPRFPLVDTRNFPAASSQQGDAPKGTATDYELLDAVFAAGSYDPLSVAELPLFRTSKRWAGIDVTIAWDATVAALQQMPAAYVVRVYAVGSRGQRALVEHGVVDFGRETQLGPLTKKGSRLVAQARGAAERWEVTVQVASCLDAVNVCTATPFTVTAIATDYCDAQNVWAGSTAEHFSGQGLVTVCRAATATVPAANQPSLMTGGRILGLHVHNTDTVNPRFLRFFDAADQATFGATPIAVLAVNQGATAIFETGALASLQFEKGLVLQTATLWQAGVQDTDLQYSIFYK